MKPKPLRKKKGKTFTFQPFSERITNLDVDIFHKVCHKNEEINSEKETYLYQAITKWNGLNSSESYNSLCKELTHHVKILPQVIAQKDKLINILIKYIKLKNEFSLQPALEFIVALAKDLTHQEFYNYFPLIFPHIINLLYCKDYEQIECSFQCLAYLFKLLWKQLVEDIDNVLDLLLPLLNNNQPLYIVNFSAQSFAYVGRKIKNRKQFIYLILKALKKSPEGEEGCGTLIFETIKGVSSKLHSCTQNFLTDFFICLGEQGLNTQCLARVLSHTCYLLISELEPEQCEIVWIILHKTLTNFLSKWHQDQSSHNEQSILNMLSLMKVMSEYKRGVTITQPRSIIELVVNMIQDKQMPETILQDLIIIAAALQRSPNVKISQEYSCQLAYNVLKVPHRYLYLDFIERVFSCAGFNTLVLPSLLNFCEISTSDSDILELLTKLVLHKVPSCSYGSYFNEWKRIGLDFTNKKQNNLINYMQSILSSPTNDNLDNIICCILISPHIRASPLHLTKLHETLIEYLKQYNKIDINDNKNIHLYVYTLLIETLLRICPEKINFLRVLDTLKECLDTVCALRTIDLCLSVLKIENKNLFNCKQVKNLKNICINNLSSPYSQIRTLSSHLLTLLSSINNEIEISMFEIIYNSEITECTLQTYREKLNLIQKLEEFNHIIGLKYMFGVLHVNFSLLWKPVCQNIVTLGENMNVKIYWEQYLNMLQKLKSSQQSHIDTSIDSSYLFLTDHYSQLTSLNDKPDFTNVRILLWECLVQLKKISSMKNRDISTLVLDFINFEFRKTDAELAKSWNIKIHDGEIEEEEIEEEDEDDDELDNSNENDNNDSINENNKRIKSDNDNESDSENEIEKPKKKRKKSIGNISSTSSDQFDSSNQFNNSVLSNSFTNRKHGKKKQLLKKEPYNKNTMRLFLSHFNVMATMQNAKSVYKEIELRKIYEEFLCHRNPIIQKVSLDCLMAYKTKEYDLYKDNLYALIDDKTFRHQLTMFAIADSDGENNNEITDGKSIVGVNGRLKQQHREIIIPIVLRIVYGKMLGGSSAKSGSKSSGAVRRSMILRFLAGCKPEEFIIFLNMAFKIILNYTTMESCLEMVQNIISNINLEHVLPPKRLLSLINLANIVLSHCGNLAMSQLFQILLCLISYVHGILNQRSLVHNGYLNLLNKCKTSIILTMNEFFLRYSEFNYKCEQIDAVFESFVWSGIDKLSTEGVYSPTALTKLFITWSKEPKYFPLLVKYRESSPSQCALGNLIHLLINDRAHITVKMVLLDVIESLVTLDDDDDDEEDTPLVVNNTVVKKSSDGKNLNYGSYILKPYVLIILKYYQNKLRSKKQDNLQARDLTIISRVTELVSDEKTSTALVNVLIPLIIKKVKAGEHVINPLLVTLLNLVKNVSQGHQFLRTLGVLFLTITDSSCRNILIDIVEVLVQKIKDEKIDINLIKTLNAMNKKWIEQPDFDKRLDAFNQIQKLITEKQNIAPTQGAIIIYTAMHYLQYEKDISLRTSSSYCLQKLCPYITHLYKNDNKNKEYLIQNTILSLIRNNIQSRKTDFKEDSIMLLGYMVRECSTLHPVLKDLLPFSNKQDPEVDMFESILHVQMHRRSRAMFKFIETCKSLSKSLNSRTITQYIIPIISQFLLNEKYLEKHHTIIDASIQSLSICCKLLRWRDYEKIINYYLSKLKNIQIIYQKQLIKIISNLLDAFHFDLSKINDNDHGHGGDDSAKKMIIDIPIVEQLEEEEENELSNSIQNENDNDDEENEEENDEDDDEDENDDDDGETLNNTTDEIKPKINLVDKILVLSKANAQKVIFSISKDILPGLYKILVMRNQSASVHKVNRKSLGVDRDEEDLIKVPVAGAIVKLLQKLPHHMLERNLPGLFMKLCNFLKSKLETVRKLTRETLQRIMITLSPKYLGALVKEMKSLLSKGFQVHVLAFTLHAVLVALKDSFTQGVLDHCTLPIIEVFSSDLFSEVAEEKNVAKIQSKVVEARSQKSFDAFCILAQYVSEQFLLNLVMPSKEILTNSLSHKLIFKASECLRHIALGLADNKFVTVSSQLTFAYGLVSQSIEALVPPRKEEKKSKLLVPEKPDCFIIPKEPRKCVSTEKKIAAKTNANILIEFGLRIYYVLLKRERLKGEEDLRGHLDVAVPIMSQCLTAEHVKLNTLSLQCLTCLIKLNLPTMETHVNSVTTNVFTLLHKFAAQGMGKGDNFELVLAAFKYVGVLLRDLKQYKFEPEQLETLLIYVEQDLHDYSKQATAFMVLKAILHRKLQCGTLTNVMKTVANLAITSHHINCRVQAKQCYITYLYEYPLSQSNLETHLSFILSQLDFDIKEGRECAQDMIDSIIHTFPITIIHEYSELIYVSCSATLINDTEPQLRKKMAEILIKLINKIDTNHAEKLLEINLIWLNDNKVSHKRLGAQLVGIFLENKSLKLVDRNLKNIISALRKQFIEQHKMKMKSQIQSEDEHHVYQVLVAILKLIDRYTNVLTDEEYKTFISDIGEHSQRLLSHEHVWIRLAAAQILFKIFSSIPPLEISSIANNESLEISNSFMRYSVRNKIKSLILDHIDQLVSNQLDELLNQVMKNLVYLAQIVKDFDLNEDKISLRWLIMKLRRRVHEEITQSPMSFTVRKMCFNWLAAMAIKLSKEELDTIALCALTPLVREMNTIEDKFEEIRQVATEAANYYKKRLGQENYLKLISTLQQRIDVRRNLRKKERAQELIKDPEKAAKRKISKQLKRKEQKKRKMDIIKKKYKDKA